MEFTSPNPIKSVLYRYLNDLNSQSITHANTIQFYSISLFYIGRKKLEETSKVDAVAKFTAKCANGMLREIRKARIESLNSVYQI